MRFGALVSTIATRMNIQTAKILGLGLAVPPALLARADDVIE